MRIFFLYNDIVKTESDLIPHIRELYENMSRENEVVIFGPMPGNGAVMDKNRVYIQVGTIPILSSLLYQILLPFAMISYHITRGRADIIYCRRNIYIIAPLLSSRILGIPYVLEENGLGADEIGWKGIQKIFRPVVHMSSLLDYRWSAHIIAVTPGIKRALIDSLWYP